MKQLLLLPVLLFSILSYSQGKTKEERQAELDARRLEVKIKPRELMEYPVTYCTLSFSKAFGVVEASIDYGQETGEYLNAITDDKGTVIGFRTEVDVLNYMYSLGWDVISTYETTYLSKREIQYVLKLRPDAPEKHLPHVSSDFKKKKK